MVTHPMKQGTYRVSSGYGSRWGTFHAGLDFAAPIGTPIYAAADGVVVQGKERYNVAGFGSWIWLDCQQSVGKDFIYGHVKHDGIMVKAGDRVHAGQQIGVVGNEGQSTGPHLHFEVWGHPGRLGGAHQDPAKYLQGAAQPGGVTKPVARPTPTPSNGHILGVDVSYFQNGMSLKRAASEGLSFAIIRTSDGTHRDWAYQSHMRDAESAGMVTAAYHYCRNPREGTSIQQQVATSVNVMGDMKRPIWLDCETPAGLSAQHVQEFKTEFERRGVRVIGIYSYIPWWEGKTIGGEPETAPYGKVWLAHYGSNPDGSPAQVYAARGGNDSRYWNYPLGNQKPVLFQYGSKAEVAGFADVDVNAFRGTKDQLKDLFYGTHTAKKEDLDLSDIDKKRIKYSLDQFVGYGTNKNGEPTFNGWDFDHLVKVANDKLANGKGLTLVEMVARTMDKQHRQETAITHLSESFDELINAVTALNDSVAQLAGANPEVK
ncbi:peptidoglycan DD-metalloendopeptidase family protein [Corynebacterium aurimucosum]|uniref:1,4-beta-N-acetylmuramidase n=1 Tax=Corynebacterium aurimucosum (strain ATCC 700975 / DSM 44827 / CIP 107346 / CN-1) TaxID=548476 RepID=C3PI49_CORA7|nr:peptidoglycan DD-metalloendopeptidase family protein [Corynebacterium aurimucosum]ACP33503.1 1,4-beta-N-acetylmuramidase [Corynebacterium aurimucosum ATCC 700975]QQU92386.1 peptidoglycan DD-metalloendopeptidase family protein [Corynebacterium aurimucosum]